MTTITERTELFETDPSEIDDAMAEGIARALEEHRLLGRSIFTWRDGRVVEIPPEEIPPYVQRWPRPAQA